MRVLLPALCFFIATAAYGQATYSGNASGILSGPGMNSWSPFTFNNTPATFGDATITFRWAACTTGGGNRIDIELRTGTNTYVSVYVESGNTQSCTYLHRSATISETQLRNALNYGAGTVQGRARILDNCSPGIGCSFNDPVLSQFNMSYIVQSAYFTSPGASICPGSTVQFNDQSINNPTGYEWSFPGGTPATSSLPNPVVQYPTTGNYNVTLTVTNSAGTSTVTRNNFVTVHALPNAFAGIDQTVCAGNTAQLQASGGSTYLWMPSTGLSNPAIANPVASPSSTSTWTVIVTSPQGCQASDAVTIAVTPQPQIALTPADGVLCQGDTLSLQAQGADLYTWSPNLFISSASGSNVQVWPVGTFTWTVTGSDLNGCTGQATTTVTVGAASQPSTTTEQACISYTWNGQTYTESGSYSLALSNAFGCDSIANLELTITPVDTAVFLAGATLTVHQEAAEYQWLDCANGNALIAGATEQSFTPEQNGVYAVQVSVNGCSEVSGCHVVLSTGISDSRNTNYRVFPVPAHDHAVIESDGPLGLVHLCDVSGRVVRSFNVLEQRMVLPLQGVPQGPYFLRIEGPSGNWNGRIIVQ
ncbi:MAG: PKD domain-containing protein [Flavobacteriales bacterium]|nr:PKD domain-containing protein [Flavobacteriales bacterium]